MTGKAASAAGLAISIGLGLTGLGLTACTQPPSNDQQLQDQAAKATEVAKKQSEEALAQARVAAANAERAVNDVAAGVKQGLHDNKPSAAIGRVDLNNASPVDLAALPGVSAVKAAQIVHHRPYASPHDLVEKGVMSDSQYARIAGQVTAQ